ncbi:MAG: asparagine synthase (glutamine-hydrolyzing) [Phycisphaerae bacterium]|nr:asparagine synthase (glutamine-hydrolyzing) [Phycisphaerae bacterium]
MCGITGYLAPGNGRRAEEMRAVAHSMADALQHRGPDSSGVWVCPMQGLALAHRRLSIIDLSANGNQPMQSLHGRYVIVFNGEIYNHRELRSELVSCGKAFRGSSDTEVILAACEEWGVEETITRCIGMFAIALWDTEKKDLYLIRDRMGEKPLYYGWHNGAFLFASELKAMRQHPSFRDDIDRDALALYFRYRYIPAPYCVYQNTYKLKPGTILRISAAGKSNGAARASQVETTYWSLPEIAEQAESVGYDGTSEEVVATLEHLLKQSIEGQMIADVPLGAFLSGGIDSTTVVALMQSLSPRPINTFCIGFNDGRYDEAPYAREIARHLGCCHTELYITPQDALEAVPRMPHVYDEPFADASQIPTFLLSKLTRKHVTVSLSGDGGDELFYGYGIYGLLFRRWRIARKIRIGSRLLRPAILQTVRWMCNADQKQLGVVDALLTADHPIDAYRAMVSVNNAPSDLVLGSREPETIWSRRTSWPRLSCQENAVMALDALAYLPDDILVKVDRAAMACSLEARIPFLDHRIVEFAMRLPFYMKFRDGTTKWPVRQILHKYVPRRLVERPKKGFGVPLSMWFRNELREWMRDVLNRRNIRDSGILNEDAVQRYVDAHIERRQDHGQILWSMLIMQCWLNDHGRRHSGAEGELCGRTGITDVRAP